MNSVSLNKSAEQNSEETGNKIEQIIGRKRFWLKETEICSKHRRELEKEGKFSNECIKKIDRITCAKIENGQILYKVKWLKANKINFNEDEKTLGLNISNDELITWENLDSRWDFYKESFFSKIRKQ